MTEQEPGDPSLALLFQEGLPASAFDERRLVAAR